MKRDKIDKAKIAFMDWVTGGYFAVEFSEKVKRTAVAEIRAENPATLKAYYAAFTPDNLAKIKSMEDEEGKPGAFVGASLVAVFRRMSGDGERRLLFVICDDKGANSYVWSDLSIRDGNGVVTGRFESDEALKSFMEAAIAGGRAESQTTH